MKSKISRLLLKLICASLAMGQIARFYLLGFPFYPHYFLIVLFVVLNPVFNLSLLVFAFTLLIHPSPYTIRLVTLLLFFTSLSRFPPSKKLVTLTLKLILTSALLQFIFFADLRFLYQFGWDDHLFRLTFPLFDPNLSGILMIFTHLYFKSASSLLATIVTFSRSTYLTLLALKPKLLVLILPLMMMAYFVSARFGEGLNLLRTYSILQRLEVLRYLPVTLTGTGEYLRFPNTYANLISVAGLLGILGFFQLVYFWGKKYATRKIYLLALLIHAFFNPSFFHPSIFLIFSLIMAYSSEA